LSILSGLDTKIILPENCPESCKRILNSSCDLSSNSVEVKFCEARLARTIILKVYGEDIVSFKNKILYNQNFLTKYIRNKKLYDVITHIIFGIKCIYEYFFLNNIIIKFITPSP